MSRVFTAATGQHLTYTGSMGVTARPVSMFMWVKFNTVAASRNALSYDNTSTANLRVNANTSGIIRFSATQTTGANSTTSGVPSTGTWLPILAIYDASGNTDLYALGESVLNGGAAGAFIAESSPKFSIGCNTYQVALPSIDAKIAHVAMWSSELDSSDRAALIAGADPSTISSGTLLAYWPLTDTSLIDTIASKTLVVTGTVNSDAADNPTLGTAPALTNPTGTATGAQTATGTVDTDTANGTLYAVDTASSTKPSAAQVKAGQDHTGAAAIWGGSLAISSTGTKTFNASGLTTGVQQYFHYMHENAGANQSAVVSSGAFTPAGVASLGSVSGDNIVLLGETGAKAIGSQLGDTTGTAAIVAAGVTQAQTITGWSSATAVFSFAQGNLPYGSATFQLITGG